MTTLKITRIGNSLGLVLPREILARLKLQLGDAVYLTDAPGGVKLSPYDQAFEEQMAAARGVVKRRRQALRELAK
jgi:putative addiction module antidote